MTPEQRAREVLTTLADVLHDSRGDEGCPDDGDSTWCRTTAQVVLDALAAAGLHVVAEGHAVIDGEVVALERTGIEGWELYGGDDTRPLLIPAEGVPE